MEPLSSPNTCKVQFPIAQQAKQHKSVTYSLTQEEPLNVLLENKTKYKPFDLGTYQGSTLGKILVCLLSFGQEPSLTVLLAHLAGSLWPVNLEQLWPHALLTFNEEQRLYSDSGIRYQDHSTKHCCLIGFRNFRYFSPDVKCKHL